MVGFAADHRAQRDQGVELESLGHVREGHAQLERAGDAGDHDVALVHAQLAQFFEAGFQLGLADFFVETGTDDADVQAFAVEIRGENVGVHGFRPCFRGWRREGNRNP